MPTDDFKGLREALAACPFCGNDAEFSSYKSDGLTLRCKSLGCVKFNQRTMRHSLDWLKAKMIEHWNTRDNPETIAALLAELDRVRGERDAMRDILDHIFNAMHCAGIDAARGKGKEGGNG